jgi:hypothetical protein
MIDLTKFELIDDPGDHGLSRMLRDRDWSGSWEASAQGNLFTNRKGEIIAVVFYDNQKLTKRAYLRPLEEVPK